MSEIKFQAILQSLKKLQGGDVRVVLEVPKTEANKALFIPEEHILNITIEVSSNKND